MNTHPANDVVVVSQMGFTLLAPKDFVACKIYVVFEAHYARYRGTLASPDLIEYELVVLRRVAAFSLENMMVSSGFDVIITDGGHTE